MRTAARSWTLLGFIRATAAWAFTTAAVFALIGFAVDGGVVLFSGHSARLAIAAGMTAAAFGALSALSVAPLFVVTAGLCHVLDARARFLWLLPIGIIAYLLTAIVAVNGVPQGAVTLPAPPNFHFYVVRVASSWAFSPPPSLCDCFALRSEPSSALRSWVSLITSCSARFTMRCATCAICSRSSV